MTPPTASDSRSTLKWPFGTAVIRSEAAILWECEFQLPSGRRFAPFARAPWAEDPAVDPSLPAHMRFLGGEFACVPFGIGGAPAQLSPDWASNSWKLVNRAPHGDSSNLNWETISGDASQVLMRLAYPADDDVEFLTRRICVVPDRPALDLELTIHVRRPTRQPIGLHPILRLPEYPAQLSIAADFEFGVTYPGHVPPGVSRVAIAKRFKRLDSIPGIRGGSVDFSTLPKDTPSEEMLMLCGVRGPITVSYAAQRAFFKITWDTNVLPSCLLWPSDRALLDPPWFGRFRGLGVEPIAAVFDAAREVALEDNPISAAGIPTAVALTPDEPLTIHYRIEGGDLL